ncbi:MAG TPA: hypothetical protein VMV57_06975 [Terracidiphilus sp.]|nr:hypothetical protein [Terracidiphilus sp.]
MSRTTARTWRERVRPALAWHVAGVTVLALLVAGMAVRLVLDWRAMRNSSAEALQTKRMELKTLTLQTAPLRGLDGRVATTREQIRAFEDKRIPADYSSIATRIGELQVRSGVRLSRVLYSQGAPGNQLTEISMDAGISGQYPQIMRFVNGLERDPMFFVIRAMSLTGQQGGVVNLRLRVSTWLRPADAARSGLQPTPKDVSGTSAAAREGE